MIKPLTKNSKEGVLYVRPPKIETALGLLVQLKPVDLFERAKNFGRDADEYVPSECLVYFIRRAMELQDSKTLEALVPILLGRCERTLISRVKEPVKEEILGKLAERLAGDGQGEIPDLLDFYEVRFNRAFETLIIDVSKVESRRNSHHVPLNSFASEDDPDAHRWLEKRLAELNGPATLDDGDAIVQEILSVLDPDEQIALTLHYVMEFEIESIDPSKETVATRCGVSGRTIRNRLTRAGRKLESLRERIT